MTLAQVLSWAAATIVIVLFIRQCRRPFGWLGRSTVRSMNARHSRVTDWGLSHVTIGDAFTILDVGCGGGRTIQKLAASASHGSVCGIDYSLASVTVARTVNAALIGSGRVDIREGSVSALPYGDGTFESRDGRGDALLLAESRRRPPRNRARAETRRPRRRDCRNASRSIRRRGLESVHETSGCAVSDPRCASRLVSRTLAWRSSR
jgi:SAM-dependent methyltransferase